MSSDTQDTLNSCHHLKDALHKAFSHIPVFDRCVFLDHPSHYNIGDHLIWLGSLMYLRQVRRAKIDYIAPLNKFSPKEFSIRSPEGVIFLHGGGNFGDLWPNHHNFRESIVQQYPNRKIVIFPQTIYFSSEESTARSAKIFNKHPDVTIFVRDDRSYEIAKQYFSNCQVYKSPDAAFQLAGFCKPVLQPSQLESILYMCRQDREMNCHFKPERLNLGNSVVDDWISYSWIKKLPENWPYVPGLRLLIREFWQRGLKQPREWFSRQHWLWLHSLSRHTRNMYGARLNQMSWSQMHSGIYQIQKYPQVVTNRLHVHILCLLLDIPHVVLPGSYYKITAFYEQWTKDIPICRFASNPNEVAIALNSLDGSSSSEEF